MTGRYDGSKGAATHLLQHYFRLMAQRTGVQWDSDNDVEIEAIVDGILSAARQEFNRDSLYDYIGDVAHKQLVSDLQHDASVQSLVAGAVEAVNSRRGRYALEAQQQWLDARAAQASTQEAQPARPKRDPDAYSVPLPDEYTAPVSLKCDMCLSTVAPSSAVQYEDGYFCPACASKALRTDSIGMHRLRETIASLRAQQTGTQAQPVPVSAIAYLMADITPVDAQDAAKQQEARATVIAWLESLEAEED